MGLLNKDKGDSFKDFPIIKRIPQTEKQIGDFVLDLSSKDPVPGGGGASALAGAIGAALGGMVASLTVGKEQYKAVEQEITILKTRAYNLQKELLELVEKDAAVFSNLSSAYKIHGDTDEEKINKNRMIEAALKDCADVPLEIMKKSCEAIQLMESFARKGNKQVVSDAGCGVILCKSALQSAWLNVCVNTKAMKNRKYAKKINEEGIELLRNNLLLADQIYAWVEKDLL